MRRLLWLLGTLITSLSLGVGIIRPVHKVFTPGQYYVGQQQNANPDWRNIYQTNMASGVSTSQESDKSVKSLSPNETTFIPTSSNGFYWFFSVNKSSITTKNNQNDFMVEPLGGASESLTANLSGFNKSQMTFVVPIDTKLIAPANSYLVPSSQYYDSPYPSGLKPTQGKYMQVIIKTPGVAYRVTYSDMKEWWTDMNKTKPDAYKDNNPKEPLYYNSVPFSTNDTFDSGEVLGVAGDSGRPASQLSSTHAYVTVSLAKCAIQNGIVTDTWYPVNISDFYRNGGG